MLNSPLIFPVSQKAFLCPPSLKDSFQAFDWQLVFHCSESIIPLSVNFLGFLLINLQTFLWQFTCIWQVRFLLLLSDFYVIASDHLIITCLSKALFTITRLGFFGTLDVYFPFQLWNVFYDSFFLSTSFYQPFFSFIWWCTRRFLYSILLLFCSKLISNDLSLSSLIPF